MKHRFNRCSTAVAALAALFLAPAAQALTTFTLNLPAVGTYGQVKLEQFDADTVKVSVTLAAGYNFVDTGNHVAFAFNVDKALGENYTLTGLNPAVGYVWADAAVTQSTFGDFFDGLTCPTLCQGGNNSALPNNAISFFINDTGITEASFLTNPVVQGKGGYYFAADVFGPNPTGGPQTFLVATSAPIPAIPEPQTYAFMLAGLASVGFMARRRRQD